MRISLLKFPSYEPSTWLSTQINSDTKLFSNSNPGFPHLDTSDKSTVSRAKYFIEEEQTMRQIEEEVKHIIQVENTQSQLPNAGWTETLLMHEFIGV